MIKSEMPRFLVFTGFFISMVILLSASWQATAQIRLAA
jgi:hypothetical protein